jgi:hypothetical protein
VTIAACVLVIAVMGTVSMLLVIQGHNMSADDARQAHKACQDVLEELLAMDYDTMAAQDGVAFVATRLHPTIPLGRIEVSDISPPGDNGTIAVVTVRVQSTRETFRPVDVAITTRRARR